MKKRLLLFVMTACLVLPSFGQKRKTYIRRKLPTKATATRAKIIQLPNAAPLLPTSKQGNTLVTELLPKSACLCPLKMEQYYADLYIFFSLSVSLRQLLYFFIFID